LSQQGNILIAHPNIPSNNPWSKTVIYIFEDNHTGTKGVILNKPSSFPVSDFLASRGMDFPYSNENMRYGGPIKSDLVTMLHTDHWYSKSTRVINSGIAISYDDFMFEKMCMGDTPSLYRVSVGVAVWQTGQLDMELAGKPPYRPENSWLIADANVNIIFGQDGERQWHKAIELCSSQMINQFF
tara:strand:+ start:78 stop:629 length:552 start_codon:yes stop_codon:yes gene_type:complete